MPPRYQGLMAPGLAICPLILGLWCHPHRRWSVSGWECFLGPQANQRTCTGIFLYPSPLRMGQPVNPPFLAVLWVGFAVVFLVRKLGCQSFDPSPNAMKPGEAMAKSQPLLGGWCLATFERLQVSTAKPDPGGHSSGSSIDQHGQGLLGHYGVHRTQQLLLRGLQVDVGCPAFAADLPPFLYEICGALRCNDHKLFLRACGDLLWLERLASWKPNQRNIAIDVIGFLLASLIVDNIPSTSINQPFGLILHHPNEGI